MVKEPLALFLKKVVVVLLVGVLAAIVWYQIKILLLVFAGMLLAILWRGVSRWISKRTKLSYKWVVPAVIFINLGLLVLFGLIAVPRLSHGLEEIVREAPSIARQLEKQIQSTRFGQEVLDSFQNGQKQNSLSSFALEWSRLFNFLTTTFNAVVDTLLILVFAFFFISEPGLYVRGLLHLVPPNYTARAREIILCLENTLFRWFIGKILDMSSIFVMTFIGLWLLDMPLIFTFSLIAFFFSFIPNIGPILSAIPPLAFALLQSPSQALYVGLLYLGIQLTESYFITPAVQKRASYVPPVLLLMVQFLLGALAGILGLFLATPLLVTAMVLISMLYIEDYLKDYTLSAYSDEQADTTQEQAHTPGTPP